MLEYKTELITVSNMMIDFYNHLIDNCLDSLNSEDYDLIFKLELIEKLRPIRSMLEEITTIRNNLLTFTAEDMENFVLPNIITMWSL